MEFSNMKVAVWDTYVVKKDGSTMHFDIIVPQEITNEETIYQYGRQYLRTKGQEGQHLGTHECKFCHIATLKPHWHDSIVTNGYYIYEMENCQ